VAADRGVNAAGAAVHIDGYRFGCGCRADSGEGRANRFRLPSVTTDGGGGRSRRSPKHPGGRDDRGLVAGSCHPGTFQRAVWLSVQGKARSRFGHIWVRGLSLLTCPLQRRNVRCTRSESGVNSRRKFRWQSASGSRRRCSARTCRCV